MEQTPLADKPDFLMAIRDDASYPSNELTVAVIAIMSRRSGCWIKLVEAAIFGAKPKIAPTVAGDARNVIATDAIRVVGVMKVAGNSVRL